MKAGAVPGNGCSSLPPAPFGAPLPSLLGEAEKRGPLSGRSLPRVRLCGRRCVARTGLLACAFLHLSPRGRGRANEVREGERAPAVQNCYGGAPSPQPSPPWGEGARRANPSLITSPSEER